MNQIQSSISETLLKTLTKLIKNFDKITFVINYFGKELDKIGYQYVKDCKEFVKIVLTLNNEVVKNLLFNFFNVFKNKMCINHVKIKYTFIFREPIDIIRITEVVVVDSKTGKSSIKKIVTNSFTDKFIVYVDCVSSSNSVKLMLIPTHLEDATDVEHGVIDVEVYENGVIEIYVPKVTLFKMCLMKNLYEKINNVVSTHAKLVNLRRDDLNLELKLFINTVYYVVKLVINNLVNLVLQ